MTAFAVSVVAVAIAEIGDKTQLLSLVLVTRFGRPGLITLGILVATLANHGLAGWLGVIAAQLVDPQTVRWILAGSFAAMAVWLLIPDRIDEDEVPRPVAGASVLLTTLVLFFLAEIGDKTQVATVVLAARYEEGLYAVVAGTTVGMLLANVPVLYGGRALMARLPLLWVNRAAALLFLLLAIATLLTD
ncbi:MAG TPA: TMEM165/GDT1 family protein [Pseudomonadales bacterium]|nr:TMEM165/GDT1 family protein [Pseudomonadales bacterium]